MIRITCLGTADAFNAGGRAHSCYWVQDALGTFSVDFGPTALMRAKVLGLDPADLDAIFVTHLHGDHIGGLAVLLIDQEFASKRTRPLIIAGPEGIEERIATLRESAFPSTVGSMSYPLIFKHWAVPGETELLGRKVQAIRARHDRLAVATSLRVTTEEGVLAFSGDTGWQPELAEISAGADFFLCECSSVEPGYWAHLSVEELREHRAALTPKQLVLTHLSVAAREAAVEAAADLAWTVADDGMVLELS